MNKKILGFSLVSNILIGSVSGVVSAENYEKEPFFSFPESCGVPKDVVFAINKAVSANNDICDFINKNREKYNKKDREITDKINNEYHTNLLRSRRLAVEGSFKNDFAKKYFKFLPWHKIIDKANFGNLFNFDTIVWDINRKVYVDNFLNDFEQIFGEIDYPNEIKKLAEDYGFYLERVKELRLKLKNWSKPKLTFWSNNYDRECNKSFVEKELAIHFQALKALKEKIEEVRNAQLNSPNQCNIF